MIMKITDDLNSLLSNDLFRIVIEILQVYNCRISEVLSARWQNFYPDKFLILEGKKHSRNVIIKDRILLEKIKRIPRTHPVLIFPHITYNMIYHYIKSRFIVDPSKVKTRKNKKITHFFRYNAVQSIANDNFIKDILNHNSLKSGKYYKNKMKGN